MKKTLTQELLKEAKEILNLDGTDLANTLHLESLEMPSYQNGTKEIPMITIIGIASDLGIKIGKYYDKIFDSGSHDMNLLHLMKKSSKDDPFVVPVLKEAMDKNLFDKIKKITGDIAEEALRDGSCDAVHIVYLKV